MNGLKLLIFLIQFVYVGSLIKLVPWMLVRLAHTVCSWRIQWPVTGQTGYVMHDNSLLQPIEVMKRMWQKNIAHHSVNMNCIEDKAIRSHVQK